MKQKQAKLWNFQGQAINSELNGAIQTSEAATEAGGASVSFST